MQVKKFLVTGVENSHDLVRTLLNFVNSASPARRILFAPTPEMASLLNAEDFDMAFGKTKRGMAVKAAGEKEAMMRLAHNLRLASLSGSCIITDES